jgi:hypothetical protein
MPPEPPVAEPAAPPVGAAPLAPPAPAVIEPPAPPVPVPPVPPLPHDVAQDPLHSIVPAGHAQTPLLQIWPRAQPVLQVPQFVGSVMVFVQTVPQVVRVQVALHAPLMQNGADAGQTVPHEPQLFTSVCVRTHESPPGPHAENGAAHAQLPALHVWPCAQARPQEPQLNGSMAVLAQ